MEDLSDTDEVPAAPRSHGQIAALHARADKAWIYRVVAVQAQAGRTLVQAFDACVRAIDNNKDEAGPHDERIQTVLGRAIKAIEAGKDDDNLLELLVASGFYLGSREQPFLDMALSDIAKEPVRASVFSALAAQLGG